MGARNTRATQIAGRLKEARDASGISVHRLSGLVREYIAEQGLDPYGTSYGTIRSYETGAVLKPRREVLGAIASVLGIRAEWLITGNGYRTDQDEKRASAQAGEVEWLGDDWGLRAAVYHRIRQETLLANMSPPVRSLFWETLRRLTSPSVADGPDELYRIAKHIDAWVCAPLDWIRGPEPTEPQLMNFRVAVLNALTSDGFKGPHPRPSALLPTPKEQE